ncbi:MAG TPA: hypothetical protein VHR36_07755 [Pyrinomonadaceae bacterium]|jgi:hypothetical protein|nr:hypothetical protein [Pyrinomonadaceae bacterium]
MKFAVALLITAFAALTVWGQSPPTLRIVTEIPNLPSDLYYGTTKVKPLRLRPGTTTPITINDSDFFVNQQYVDFLGRFPDQDGLNYWQSNITACGSNPSCIDFQRTNTSGAFFLSIEFQETGYLVYRMYKAAYGDADGSAIINNTPTAIKVPVIRRQEFLPDMNQVRNGVQVGIGNWAQQLEANKTAYATDFVQRARFTSAYPTSLSPSAFVTQLFAAAGVTPSAQEQQDAVNEFGGAGNTADAAARGRALRRVAENNTLKTNENNRAFVLMQYFGYLRRNVDEGPDNDFSGWKFWLDKLNAHGGDFHSAEMVKAFIVSGEYLNRF